MTRRLIIAACLTLSCAPDLSLPGEVWLSCASDADCPPPLACREAVHRCYRPDPSAKAPAIVPGSASVTPREAGLASTIHAEFEVDLALAGEPAVQFAEARERPFVREGRTGNRWRFSRTLDGTEPEGPVTVVATLVADSGAESADQPVGTVTLDFVAPTLLELAGPEHPIGRGAIARVTLRSAEPLTDDTRVELVGGGAFARVDDGTDARRGSFTYTATGDEAAGATDVAILLSDPAGNTSPRTYPGVVTFDFEPPTIVTAEVLATPLRPGAQARVRLAFSERLNTEEISLALTRAGEAPIALVLSEATGGTLEFAGEVPPGTADGAWEVALLSFADLAGNAGTPGTVASLAVDGTPPAFASLPTFNRTPPLYRSGEVFSLAFEVDEALSGAPEATLGTSPRRPLGCESTGGRTWRCDLPPDEALDGLERPEGTVGVGVTLRDLAGNAGFESPSLTLDFTPPAVVASSARVTYLPSSTNPLRDVSAATEGTTVRVTFTTTERLARPPEVVARGPGTLAFELVSDDSPAWTYALVWPADGDEGTWTLGFSGVDAAGNPGAGPIGTFIVDRTPPVPPDVNAPDAVTYRREPWGSAASGGARRFQVELRADAVPGASVVIARDGASSIAGELGRAAILEESTVVPLLSSDRPVVYVAALDAAGNASPAVAVRDVRWTARLNGKVAGSRFENPTTLAVTPVFEPVREQDLSRSREATQAELDAAAGIASGSAVAVAEQAWLDRTPLATNPSMVSVPAMAYDAARGRAVLFGVSITGVPETWEWDSPAGHWTKRALSGTQPVGRDRHTLVYDAVRARVLLYGGCGVNGTTLDDVWEWDGTAGSWIDRTPSPRPAGWPAGRYLHAATYDSVNGRALFFGGFGSCNGGNAYGTDELWAWDSRTGTFSDLRPATRTFSTWPFMRNGAGFAFDPLRAKAVLFGDYLAYDSDTWEFDVLTGTWTNVAPAPHPAEWPAPRRQAGLAFDGRLGQVVLFGGGPGATGEYRNDLWRWNGAVWSPVEAGGSAPAPRQPVVPAYDLRQGRLVVYGGTIASPGGGATLATDTWEWDALGWVERTPNGRHPVSAGGVTFDRVRKRLVVLAADDAFGSYGFRMWDFDPRSGAWVNRSPAEWPQNGSWPGPRAYGVLVHDEARGRTFLFGGAQRYDQYLSDVWEWDGATGTWTNRTPATLPTAWPEARISASGSWDSVSSRVLVRGGGTAPDGNGMVTRGLGDLWSWDGGTGTFTARGRTSPPPPMTTHAAAIHAVTPISFDRARGRLLLGQPSELFGWDPGTDRWTALTPSPPPGDLPLPRSPEALVYDTRSRASFLLWNGGRLDADGAFLPLPVHGARPLPSFQSSHVGWDPDRARALAVAGGETWEWASPSDARPAWLWSVPLDALGESRPALTFLGWRVKSGGTGGSEVASWDVRTNSWRPLGSGAAPSDTPADTSASTSDARELQRFASGVPEAVVLAIRPRAVSGAAPQPASVALRGVELTVGYRR